ncbi:MAG: glycosyltransferase family 39 protein [Kofleriaceae bacterium]
MRLVPPRAVGWILAAITVAIVLANQAAVGVARDEVVYMDAGDRYADWWLRLAAHDVGVGKDSITGTFGGKHATDNNREHPPLMKTLVGLSHRFAVLARSDGHRMPGALRGVAWAVDQLSPSELTAYRLPTALLHGLLVLLVFLMVLEVWGYAEAITSGLVMMFLPRALFHAGLVAFDAPIMAMWFAAVYAYWRCLDGRSWPWQLGIVFGLALATKHNAFLLPFAFILHYPIAGLRARGLAGIVVWRWRVIVSLIVLAPLTLLAVWPWLWLDPIGHVTDWLSFHTNHVNYHFEYLGKNWNAPPFPWHVALLTTALTVPTVTLVAAGLGFARWIVHRTRDARMPALLLGLSAVAAIAPFFIPTTPIFGAEKHWMPALPTLCIAAGVGTVWAARQAARAFRPRFARPILSLVVTAVVAAAVVETVVAQPYALSSYTALAGGAPGGADLGMNRQFWGISARGVLPVLAGEGTPSAELPVYAHDASPAWDLYQRLGLLPRTRKHAGQEQSGVDRSKLAIVVHEKHFNKHDYMIWRTYRTLQPFYVLRFHGVPIVSVYRRPTP